MSSRLLAECMDQFGLYGSGPEFRSYLMGHISRLLASRDVACGLVVLTAQEDDHAGNALQLLSMLLDEARMGLENDSAHAGDFLETVEMAVEAGLTAGALQQMHLAEFARLYRRAGLPVPHSFLLDPDSISPPPDMEGFDLSELLEGVARDVLAGGGSAFDLFGAVDSMLAAVPEQIQASLANHLATLDTPIFERCALFILLAWSNSAQEATIAGLNERLDKSALTAETMALLPMIRGWFADGATREALDALIRKARRKPMPAQPDSNNARIQEMVASITDGVGAQSIAVLLKKGRKNHVAMILLKTGHGIKDAFLSPSESSRDAKNLMTHMRTETGADDISDGTLRLLLEAALADGIENGRLPAPGFLDVIEECNLLELRPQQLGLEGLLDFVDPERKIRDASPQALGRWINDDLALMEMEQLTDSWFEDTEQTREFVARGRTVRSIETKVWTFLEGRRDLWARRFLQTALMLRDGERLRESKTLTASAYGLMSGRSLKRIPLIEDIMLTTIEAADTNMW